MLLRLLLALTIALLTMPAVAACHVEQPAAKADHGAHHGGHHEPAKKAPPAAEQLCIGCVAPATARSPQFAPPPAFTRADTPGEALSGVELAGSPPATPPPKPEA